MPTPTRSPRPTEAARQLNRRRRGGTLFAALCLAATLFGIAVLAVLLLDIAVQGLRWVDWGLLTEYPSRIPERAGVKSAIAGTFWTMLMTAAIAVPLGVGAAVYLEEYARRGWLYRFVTLNIANLAGVPSVIYGILGLTLFVRLASMGASLLAGALTMALLILPVLIISTQEALRAVPKGLRESAYALGATRWQTVRSHLLPVAAPGALTGVILSLSRAIGETAPLLVLGTAAFVPFLPADPLDLFTVLPIQIFDWTKRPQEDFRGLAAAGIIVLMLALLALNGTAIYLRNRFEKSLPR